MAMPGPDQGSSVKVRGPRAQDGAARPAPAQDASGPDAPGQDAPGQDAPGQDAPAHGTPGQETRKQETRKQETRKQDAASPDRPQEAGGPLPAQAPAARDPRLTSVRTLEVRELEVPAVQGRTQDDPAPVAREQERGAGAPAAGDDGAGSARAGALRGGSWPGRRRLLLGLCALALACGLGVVFGALHPALGALMMVPLLAMFLSLPPDGGPLPAPAPAAPEPMRPVARPDRRDAQAAAVVAALPEPALLLSATGEIMTANERVALAIGPTRVGDPLSFVVRVPEVLDAVRAAAADGIPRRVEFAERIPLDRWLEAHVVPLRLDAQQGAARGGEAAPDAVLLTFRDLTQQRRVEQMRADFVANASHELRTPLASLSGFIETLQGPARNDTAARERFLSIMASQAKRMSRLIDDLLSLSRIELNAHVRPQTKVDLSGIVAHVCDTLSPLAHDRGVLIEQAQDTDRLEVFGDRDELIRLFENLVENALKYAATGKKIRVSVTREAGATGNAVVCVRDHGPGIAPEHLPRLTERFYRVDVAASRDQGGTGLGLAIVKHIVARHRGRLGIDSVLGDGATFTVRLDALPRVEKNAGPANT